MNGTSTSPRRLRTGESLEKLDAALRGGVLRIPSEDRSQMIEWQSVEGWFMHDRVTIQRRVVGSCWEDVTVGNVLEELRKGGAVALWLRQYTRANVSFESLSLLDRNEDAHLKMLPDDSDENLLNTGRGPDSRDFRSEIRTDLGY